jgi:AraC family transcriptional regulator, positive regulator of tynA and feaB
MIEIFMPRIAERRRAIPTTSSVERPAPSSRGNGLANPSGQLREALTQNFPYVLFDVPPDSDGDITVRKIGAHAIAHLRTASWTAEATVGHADALGFGETIKLVWQLNGTMTYEDEERAFAINAGELFLTRSSSDYFLNMSEDYEGLVLTFDASAHPVWLNLVERGEKELVLKPSSAAAASAAGMMALMRQSDNDSTSELVLNSLFELATGSVNHGIADPPSEQVAPSLFRARWLIRQHIADLDYTPARLAHDLGLSRRSLYNRFADRGITPAAFIRMVRLEQAKREIESDPTGITALTTVALRNGFPDSSSLSHAIKANYGVTPKALRNAGARQSWRG